MGSLQKQLSRLLASQGIVDKGKVAYPRGDDVKGAGVVSDLVDMYRKLGGTMATPPHNLRAWDIEFDGYAVELDECLHFNRYRLLTLESPRYALLPGFPLKTYRSYCSDYESECLAGTWGKRWSTVSSDRQFGVAPPLKDFSDNGPSRWKQRAFYDFVKDISSEIVGTKVVRIAVWDDIEDEGGRRSVGSALRKPSTSTADAIVSLIRSRGVG